MFLKLTPKRDGWYLWLFTVLFAAKLLAPTAQMLALSGASGETQQLICASLGNYYLEQGEDEETPGMSGDACPLCALLSLADTVSLAQNTVAACHGIGAPLCVTYLDRAPAGLAGSYVRSRSPPLLLTA